MFDVAALPFDSHLGILGLTSAITERPYQVDPSRTYDEVRIAWTGVSPGATSLECIRVAVKPPGSSDFSSTAQFLLPASATSLTDSPGPTAGEYCYLLTPLTNTSRGQASQACLVIDNPTLPIAVIPTVPPTTTPLAPNTGDARAADRSRPPLAFVLMALAVGTIAAGAGMIAAGRPRR